MKFIINNFNLVVICMHKTCSHGRLFSVAFILIVRTIETITCIRNKRCVIGLMLCNKKGRKWQNMLQNQVHEQTIELFQGQKVCHSKKKKMKYK